MASISSTGSSTSSILSSMSSGRLTGLVSGLDTDSLVESMTASTRSKIAKIQQQQQMATWKMEAYRSVSSKLIAFQNKYTSYTSSTNLRSPSFYSKSLITTAGNSEYSKYVKATGNGEKLGTATIAGVKQLAQKTSYVSKQGSVSNGDFVSEAIDASAKVETSKLAGQNITLKYGTQTISLTLSKEADYNSKANVESALADALKEAGYDDKIKMTFNSDGQLEIDYASEEIAGTGNTIEVTKVGNAFSELFGIEKGDKATGKGTKITGDNKLTDSSITSAVGISEMAETLAGKSLTFSYNGKSTTITFGSVDELNSGSDVMKNVQSQIQEQMDKAYGSGRVTVDWDGKNLSFRTTYPTDSDGDGKKDADTTSTLSLSSGDADALKALGLKSGMSNRLNTTAALKDSGINFQNKNGLDNFAEKDYTIRIKDCVSGKIHEISETIDGKKFDANTSMEDIMKAINASDAQVQVSYLSTSDQFTLTSTQEGASGDFAIIQNDDNGENLGTAIFGTSIKGMSDAANGKDAEGNDAYSVAKGQDAIIYVDYDGEGGADPVEMSRSSNSFDLNGVTISVSGVFNMKEQAVQVQQMQQKTNENGNPVVDENGNPVMEGVVDENGKPVMVDKKDANGNTVMETVLDKDAEDVTFEAKADVEKITTAFKEMIEAYNEIIDLANTMVSETPDRDYAPLTDEQKEEMSESEIENWEKKAKAGILFNDSDLRGFTSEIRFLFEGDSKTIQTLENMGITSATSYSSHGKIVFDEEKFKSALENNLDDVKEIFTASEESTVDANGNKVVTKSAGIMNQMKTVFDKYAAVDTATKGIFVQMAGATESPLSMLDNYLQDQLDSYADRIKTLQEKLEDEAERYYEKFSSLEVYMNNMNTQSSWLYSETSSY